MHPRIPALSLILLASAAMLLTTACGDDEGSSFEWEGVYTITSWTENPTGCDMEGPSIQSEQTHTRFIAQQVRDPLVGLTLVMAGACPDPQACADSAAGGLLGALFGGDLAPIPTSAREGEVYRAPISSANYNSETDRCEGTASVYVLSSAVEGQIRLERTVFDDITFEPGPENDMGSRCEADNPAFIEAIEAGTCSGLEVIVADNPESVPPPSEQ